MRRSSNLSQSLFVEILDTRQCLDIVPELNSFEDSVFGPDFAVSLGEMEKWAESGCWFCAAVTGQAVPGRRQVFSMLSVLITTAKSKSRLLEGELTENQLQPWASDPEDDPSVYLASVISAAPRHLRSLYATISKDLHEFKEIWGAGLLTGFGIASGPSGYNHMTCNGFRSSEGRQYRGLYPLMEIDARSAATRFWQDLFNNEELTKKIRALQVAAALSHF